MHPLETYLEELAAARASGAALKETSGYGALANLLNVIGHTLKPKVRCLIQLKNSGAGTRLTKDPLNLSLTAGWGHGGNGGVTMPGKGKLETRGYTAEEAEAFSVGQASRLSPASKSSEKSETGATPVLPLLGPATHDVFLNNAACWRNVPEKVWDYTIGGYQVIKKWLSYREFALLGRALTPDEAREVTHMARRIAALILLQPELDANYQRVKAATFAWKP